MFSTLPPPAARIVSGKTRMRSMAQAIILESRAFIPTSLSCFQTNDSRPSFKWKRVDLRRKISEIPSRPSDILCLLKRYVHHTCTRRICMLPISLSAMNEVHRARTLIHTSEYNPGEAVSSAPIQKQLFGMTHNAHGKSNFRVSLTRAMPHTHVYVNAKSWQMYKNMESEYHQAHNT